MAISREGLRAILLLVAGLVAGGSADRLLEDSSRHVAFASGILRVISLFVLGRESRRFYGLIEIAFGGLALWDASAKGRGPFNADFGDAFSKYQPTLILLQTFAAIYVLIRGFDNVVQGWPRLRGWWEGKGT